MYGLKIKDTYYKGYRFRSRLEARWAVFFDACGVDWEYEPEGYDLGNGMSYLPDFKLHGVCGRDDRDNEKTLAAFNKARQARFEFGETPEGR